MQFDLEAAAMNVESDAIGAKTGAIDLGTHDEGMRRQASPPAIDHLAEAVIAHPETPGAHCHHSG